MLGVGRVRHQPLASGDQRLRTEPPLHLNLELHFQSLLLTLTQTRALLQTLGGNLFLGLANPQIPIYPSQRPNELPAMLRSPEGCRWPIRQHIRAGEATFIQTGQPKI